MLGLDAYGSSSDDEGPGAETETVPAPEPAARAPPAMPSKATARASDVTFSKLPPAARRVVTIPAPALARALDDDSDSDSDAIMASKRRKTAQTAGGSGASLTSALPKPKRAALGGGGALGAGALGGGGAMLDLGTGGFGTRANAEANECGDQEEEEEEAGPHAAAMYAVGDDGEYVNPNAAYAYDADAYDDDENGDGATMPANEGAAQGSFVDQALAAAAKAEYERHGREIKITSLSAADLRKRPGHGKTAPMLETEGMFQQVQATRASSTARNKHQITSLLHEAKVNEKQILEAGFKANATRAQNRKRYGW
jgi:hypothetical protein